MKQDKKIEKCDRQSISQSCKSIHLASSFLFQRHFHFCKQYRAELFTSGPNVGCYRPFEKMSLQKMFKESYKFVLVY